jgi:hypothetical protein
MRANSTSAQYVTLQLKKLADDDVKRVRNMPEFGSAKWFWPNTFSVFCLL